jgi:hypothetical protein
MNESDYKHNMEVCETALRQAALFLDMISEEDLEAMKRTVSMADSVGSIIDPTRYRDALQDGRLEYQRDLLNLTEQMKAGLAKLRAAQLKMSLFKGATG